MAVAFARYAFVSFVMMSGSSTLTTDSVQAVLDEINNYEEQEVVSCHTLSISDDSEGNPSDDDAFFDQEVNYLERMFFDSLHELDVGVNQAFPEATERTGGKRLSDFENKHFHSNNVTPDRPCTAFFKTESYVTPKEVFEALKNEGFAADHVRCLQRKPTGEIFITFKTQEIRDAFLKTTKFTSPRAPNTFFVPQNSERPLTFLTIFDAPYELSDEAIIHRLAPYCEVMWHRRGKFAGTAGTVYNGLRHYRICVDHPIPSYLRFGKFLIRLQHDGQIPTCRKCNRPDHKAAECKDKICFNCDGLGHEARECARPMYCCICKSGQHLARNCTFSWRRGDPDVPQHSHPGEVSAKRDDNHPEPPPPGHASDVTAGGTSATSSDAPEITSAGDGGLTADQTPPASSPLDESQATPVPGSTPTPEGDFTEPLDSLGPSLSTVTLPTQDVSSPSLNEEGYLVEKTSGPTTTVSLPNTVMPSTPESRSSWADIVDRASSTASSSLPKRDPTPRRGLRQRIIPVPSLIPALIRKKTQPVKVPTSKATHLSRENPETSEEMDTTGGNRKRSNDADDGGSGGKHPA